MLPIQVYPELCNLADKVSRAIGTFISTAIRHVPSLPNFVTFANAQAVQIPGPQERQFFQKDKFSEVLQKCNALDHDFLDNNPSYFLCQPDVPGCLTNSESVSVLQESIHQGMTDCASTLIQRQWGISYQDPEGNTVLHYAASTGNTQILDELRLNNYYWTHENIDAKNNHGQTALHLATRNGFSSAVAKLLEQGANPNIKIDYQIGPSLKSITPLQLAVINGHQTCLDAYMAAKKQPCDPLNPVLNLALHVPGIGNLVHLAVYSNNYGILEHLLTKYWDLVESQVTELNDQGETPLMLASRLGNARMIQFFQKKNVNLEQENTVHQRAIHFAAKAKQDQALALLNYYGVDLTVQDKSGITPKEYLANALAAEPNAINPAKHPLLTRFDQYIEQRQNAGTIPMRMNWLTHPPENLVFKGGGPKGIAYMGALNVLEENGLLGELKRTGGTSAGAIQASLLAVGYKSEEMIAAFNSIDPREFMDHPVLKILSGQPISKVTSEICSQVGVQEILQGLAKLYNLCREYAKAEDATDLAKDAIKDAIEAAAKALWQTTGICDGDVFREWLDEKIAEKAALALGKSKKDLRYLSFGELRKEFIEKGIPGFRHLYVNTINIQTGKPITINSEDPQWDHVIISDAVRASMSIPAIFKPHVLHELPENQLGIFDEKLRKDMRSENKKLGTFVDGGLIANYPIDIFDYKKFLSTSNKGPGIDFTTNPRTLGLSNHWVDKPTQENRPIETIGDLLLGITSIYTSGEDYHLSKNHANQLRTISIDNLGVSLWDFGTDPIPLLHSGEKIVTNTLNQFTNETGKDLRYTLEANGVKLPQKYPATLRQFAENLEALYTKLLQPGTSTPKMILWSTGSEKQELAISFKNRYADEFSRILWITPGTASSVYQALAKSLQIDFKQDGNLDELRSQVHIALERHKEEKPYLLIFEGFEKTPPFPQGENGRFIILADQKPPQEEAANALHPPFFSDEEKQYLRSNYFKEIFSRLHNPNCEESNCWDLDERQLYPREKQAIEAINSNRWFSGKSWFSWFGPKFKENQE